MDRKSTPIQYYEVDLTKEYSMCIKAITPPTIEGLTKFLAHDLEIYGGQKVLSFNPIDKEDAMKFYDFSNEANWPIYGEKM